MSSIESYDGLCGIIARFASSNLQLRCHYSLGHDGECSHKKYENFFIIKSSCDREDYEKLKLNQKDEDGFTRGFIDSVIYHKK